MYTIIMNPDKSLSTSVKTTLYQRESLVDKIQFLLPPLYGNLDLTRFKAVLKYLDQGNVAQSEELIRDPRLYKGRIRYTIPMDTKLTKFAGDITIRITLTYVDSENQKVYVFHTGETTITISPLSDYYAFVDDDSLEVLDQKIVELDARLEAAAALAESIDVNKADDIVITEENRISLLANGEKIGSEWDIVTPRINDGDVDGDYNGIIDLGNLAGDKADENPDTETGDTGPDDEDDDGCGCPCCDNPGFIEL